MEIRKYSTYKDSRFYLESIGENYSTIFDRLIRLTAKLTESYAGDIYYELCEIERLIFEYNKTEKQCPLRMPDLKIVVTGGPYGYKREDGVFVLPIGCLKD